MTDSIDVVYIDSMGTDKSIVNAARVSFAKDSMEQELDQKDEKLINYLAKHNHWSPFAHNSIQLKIKAPIFIARQLVKHQVGGVWNEESRRYISTTPEFFTPESWRGVPVNAKQGSAGLVADQNKCNELLIQHHDASLALYNTLLEMGVCPEQARMVLPLSTMTNWYWTGSLMFWARVCKQRLDGHSQEEAQQVAALISTQCQRLFPISWAALMSDLSGK